MKPLSPSNEHHYAKARMLTNKASSRRPVIIDTDTDIDDLWAVAYSINVPTIDVVAITAVGDGFSSSILGPIDTYLTSPKCLNQTANIYLQPSPFDAVELIVQILKHSHGKVDILALGPLTNIAEAISTDRTIVKKIGTLYFSGGDFQALSQFTLLPPAQQPSFPYHTKNKGSSWNVFLDVLAMQRVASSGIKLAAMPSPTQLLLPTNLTMLEILVKKFNIKLTPFLHGLITNAAKCTNQDEGEIKWWDNSAAQLMVQMQTKNNKKGFCKKFETVSTLFFLIPESDQLFGHGVVNLTKAVKGQAPFTICTQVDETIFLKEFLTKLISKKHYSCATTYKNRYDIALQRQLSG
ncbi:unnamed protein product [Didymodactylos carnosus]|uniref:Inosine/uridine-preferring nucleoside hydrolase domain-containing protein n=1 Tax=Didymodactylos carnosus TaxID=1234261 RepID=A0A8S2HPQ4_9BILA|nr:unnamed protein product [Didymodactylos carnosus]CAF3673256.1 unnamed protein product [Didymodactylos carnosus]